MPPGRLNPHGTVRTNIDAYKQRRLAAHVKHCATNSRKRSRSPSASGVYTEAHTHARDPSGSGGDIQATSPAKAKKLKANSVITSANTEAKQPQERTAVDITDQSPSTPRRSICDLVFSEALLREVRAMFESIHADLGETYDGSVYLFNEQYIVKPRECVRSQFGWHTDRREQLKMVRLLFPQQASSPCAPAPEDLVARSLSPAPEDFVVQSLSPAPEDLMAQQYLSSSSSSPTPSPTSVHTETQSHIDQKEGMPRRAIDHGEGLSAASMPRRDIDRAPPRPPVRVRGDALPPYVSVWFPLDDVSEENGPLWMLPLHVTSGNV